MKTWENDIRPMLEETLDDDFCHESERVADAMARASKMKKARRRNIFKAGDMTIRKLMYGDD